MRQAQKYRADKIYLNVFVCLVNNNFRHTTQKRKFFCSRQLIRKLNRNLRKENCGLCACWTYWYGQKHLWNVFRCDDLLKSIMNSCVVVLWNILSLCVRACVHSNNMHCRGHVFKLILSKLYVVLSNVFVLMSGIRRRFRCGSFSGYKQLCTKYDTYVIRLLLCVITYVLTTFCI